MSMMDFGYVKDQKIVVPPNGSNIEVVSQTQRIIVTSGGSISIVNAGPVGPRGPAGASSAATNVAYVHEQSVPSADWGPIHHGLHYDPAGFHLQDTSGNVYEGFDVEYIDTDNLTIHLGVPFAGRVRMS